MKNAVDRRLMKKQAKKLIKKKVFALFIITLVVYLLISGNAIYKAVVNVQRINDVGTVASDIEIDENTDIENFDIENFDYSVLAPLLPSVKTIAIGGISTFLSVLAFIFGPLDVTLCGTYLILARRPESDEFKLSREMRALFKSTFNSSYFNKFVVVIIRNILITLLCFLFVVPGIVFAFSSYFTYQLMCDYPNLSPIETITLSKKLIKGNRTELFLMNMSYIGWGILAFLSFGIIGIYVMPYKCTVDALYYEEFIKRGLADGRVTKYDFLNARERAAAYAYDAAMAQQQYYQQ